MAAEKDHPHVPTRDWDVTYLPEYIEVLAFCESGCSAQLSGKIYYANFEKIEYDDDDELSEEE